MSEAVYSKDAIAEWNKRTQRNVYLPAKVDLESILFKDLFKKYLPKGNLDVIEIGAIPGRFLIYLHKKHNYNITGLDFSENHQNFHSNMKLNSIRKYNFINKDFEEFASKKLYDIVLSFGFIEHFNNYEEIVRKHCMLVKNNGYVFIEVPNFRRIQYIYHYLFDRSNLKIHNTKSMNGKMLDSILVAEGFSKVFNGYVGRLELWREPSPINFFLSLLNRAIIWFVNFWGKYFPVSSLYSPFLVIIYKKEVL